MPGKLQTGFFVPESLEENQEKKNKNREKSNDRLDLIIIAMAKKMNMSFVELNQFRVSDFLETFNIFTGKSNGQNEEVNKPRKATQKDIDIMMGRR